MEAEQLTFTELVEAIQEDNNPEPTIDAYHEWVDEIALDTCDLEYCAMKLGAESGEVQDLVAKPRLRGEYYDMWMKQEDMKKELGDVLWYVTRIANLHDLTLDEIMEANVEKLESRRSEGTLATREGRTQ